ncbi:hypothetical protein E8E11_009750 [Didymella keratinophila]|nr:hypothetical protein E8E11_009750 [Didymella keratinophila]
MAASASSSSATSLLRKQTIVLHDDGDVTLVVGKNGHPQQPIKASKSAMSLASSVWKAMFSRVWAEHEASEILLPDDDMDAILLVLRIAHLRFQDLPKKGALPLQSLLDLAIVCDKYDLVHLVRPFLNLNDWASIWFPNLTTSLRHAELLFVAWTFGYSTSFKSLANDVVLQMTMTVLDVPYVYGKEFPDAMPPGLLEKMLDLRKEAIASILNICYANLDSVLVGSVCKQQPPSEDDCRCMIMGSYTSFLMSLKLYPLRKLASEITSSVQKLSDNLGAVKIRTYESHDYKAIEKQITHLKNRKSPYQQLDLTKDKLVGHGITEHKTCGDMINIGWRAKEICEKMPSAVLNEHTVHMAAQANK